MKNATNRPEGWESSRINHNRKGGAFEIEQPKVGPKGEPRGSERVKGHGEHGVENKVLNKVEIGGRVWDQMGFFNHQ
jgi:hypothetical protein